MISVPNILVVNSKSPYNTANHIYTLIEGMPPEHEAQVQGLMWLTGRKWWDFQSFDPRLPAPLNRYVQRVERNDIFIKQLEVEVIAFNAEVAVMVEKLREYKA